MQTEDSPQAPAFPRCGRLLQVLPGTPGLWVDVTRITTLGPPADDSEGVTLWIGPRPYLLPIAAPRVVQAIGAAQLDWERERAHAQERGRLEALDGHPLDDTAPEESPWP